MNLDPYLLPVIKINPNQVKDLKKAEIIIQKNSSRIKMNEDFFR